MGIFLDFQKAFDILDYGILLDKLYCYGIRGFAHEWFISCLSNRQQSVIYSGHKPELKVMRCGVPQGSNLGPIPLLLYINDLTNVSSCFMLVLFADGTDLFWTGTDLKNMILQINEEWAKIYACVNANRLSLNIDKTIFMLFMPKNSSHCADHIVLNHSRIQEVKETKFLCVIIDDKLKWSAHIKYISKKNAKVLVSYWNQEKFSVMRPCYHCTIHLYILIWVTVNM